MWFVRQRDDQFEAMIYFSLLGYKSSVLLQRATPRLASNPAGDWVQLAQGCT